jgi:ABC-2 type transport system ATP-binding protein
MINIIQLHKAYGSTTVLRGLNLSVTKGSVIGIVGENGAGKTTLFRCVAGLEDYDGQVNSDVVPLKNVLGLLPTDPYFIPKMTAREYLTLLTYARQVDIKNFDDRNIFDLPLDQLVSTYSTGMKKKLALNAILLQKNDVYILDEPYNGVDIQSNMVITQIIHELKAKGKTILISSHIFSTLRETCDEIYLLKNGEISPPIQKKDFDRLETEMKQFSIGDKIQRLDL